MDYPECNSAVKRIIPRINLEAIFALIDSVECLSDLQKEFLKRILRLRKEIILDTAYERLQTVH